MDALEEEEPQEEKKKPSLGARVYAKTEEALGPAAPALAPVLFVLGWAYVNALFGAPDPIHGWGLSWLTPSPDALGLFALVGLLATLRGRSPAILTLLLMLGLFPMWLLRAVDRLARPIFERPFHPAVDHREAWELFILLDDTVDRFTIILYLSASGVLAGLAFAAAHQVFAFAGRRFFVSWPARIGFAVVAALIIVAELATGAVSSESLVLRSVRELSLALEAGDRRQERSAELDRALASLGEGHDLSRLREADVHVLVVPRYAQILRDDPRFASELSARWAGLEEALAESRYEMRTTTLSASGAVGLRPYSVLALNACAPVPDGAAFDAIVERQPSSLGWRFDQAGYRAVHVLAAETRERPERELGGYDLAYHSWELGYLGPPFGRSPMPDQYTLALVRDREHWETEEPLFVLYELSSSLMPFSPRPPYLEDWSEIGRGDVFRTPPPGPSSHDLFTLEDAAADYRASILYVLDVLEGFLTEHVDAPAPDGRGRESRRARRRRPPPLFVVLGDRPPLPPLAGSDASRGVIAHAISRRDDHLAPFAEAGWSEGLVPDGPVPDAETAGGLETVCRLLTAGMSATEEEN